MRIELYNKYTTTTTAAMLEREYVVMILLMPAGEFWELRSAHLKVAKALTN